MLQDPMRQRHENASLHGDKHMSSWERTLWVVASSTIGRISSRARSTGETTVQPGLAKSSNGVRIYSYGTLSIRRPKAAGCNDGLVFVEVYNASKAITHSTSV